MSKKINIVLRLQHWMDSVPGQTFLNYAYSWGAAIVILGALFKLTYLKGGDIMLFVGMGTEVFVFFLSAFDRPFDREAIGKELPKEAPTDEDIQHALETENVSTIDETKNNNLTSVKTNSITSPVTSSGEILETKVRAVPQDQEAVRLAEIIRVANDELLHRAQAVLSPEMEQASAEYITKLNLLNETLSAVDEQNRRLTKDSEEMENLNRTLTGINKVYELHLKSISLQVGTIDDINEQTHKLAEQIQELNLVYGRMIEALTINMAQQGGRIHTEPKE